MFMSAF
jgi:hypothetical protein